MKQILTDNQVELAKSLDLEVYTDEVSGQHYIVSNGKTLSNADIQDTYYPELISVVVTNEVTRHFRGANLLGSVFTKEDWINGLKRYFYSGLVSDENYSKDISIADFNPADPKNEYFDTQIQFKKMFRLKITILDILTAFTTPSALESFVNNIVGQLVNSLKYFSQNEQTKYLAQTTDAIATYDFDRDVDTTSMDVVAVLNDMRKQIRSYNTASNQHIKIGVADESMVYSGTQDNLIAVFDSNWSADIQDDLAGVFHKDGLVPNVKVEYIDFSKIKSVDTATLAATKAFLMDKKSIVLGVQLDETNYGINVPKGQKLQELHSWFGYAKLPNFPVVRYADITPTEAAKTKKTLISNIKKHKKLA